MATSATNNIRFQQIQNQVLNQIQSRNQTFSLNQLVVTDVALTSANTTTINGTQFFQQPISLPRPIPMTTREERLIHHLRDTRPEYGPHKRSPRKGSNFYEWNRRRMKGEARLLKYLDTEDRLLWFEHKAICLQYSGDKRLCGHPNRILLICPKGLYEFATYCGYFPLHR